MHFPSRLEGLNQACLGEFIQIFAGGLPHHLMQFCISRDVDTFVHLSVKRPNKRSLSFVEPLFHQLKCDNCRLIPLLFLLLLHLLPVLKAQSEAFQRMIDEVGKVLTIQLSFQKSFVVLHTCTLNNP